MRYLWNISSHGWGHAARQRYLISHLLNYNPECVITIASDVPSWFWADVNVRVIAGVPSPRVYENGWDVDFGRTLKEFVKFLENRAGYLQNEVDLQRELQPDLVVSDIDPLPVAAAGINSIPSLGIANFTWDWIMGRLFPDMEAETEMVGNMYRCGSYLRLTPGPSHSPFRSTVDIPMLLSGRSTSGKERHLDLPEGKICLMALREPPPNFAPELPEDWTMISSAADTLADGIINIHPTGLYRMGLDYSDLFQEAEVVVTKPGYGIVSMILATGKPCVLISGRSFPEEAYLLEPFAGRRGTVILPLSRISELPNAVMEVHSAERPEPAAADGAETIITGGYLDPDGSGKSG